MRFRQCGFTASDKSALAQRERGVQWRKKFKEARGEVARGVEAGRRGVDWNQATGHGRGCDRSAGLH